MTVKVVYTGPDDVRILFAKDLHTHAGVEHFSKTEFVKGEQVEVPAAVAEALVGGAEHWGTFERVERDAPAVKDDKAEAVKK